MKELTNSFWAAVFILMASVLAVVALHSTNTAAGAVITMASSIITGAFGYIQGRPPRAKVFRRGLEEELARIDTFLKSR